MQQNIKLVNKINILKNLPKNKNREQNDYKYLITKLLAAPEETFKLVLDPNDQIQNGIKIIEILRNNSSRLSDAQKGEFLARHLDVIKSSTLLLSFLLGMNGENNALINSASFNVPGK